MVFENAFLEGQRLRWPLYSGQRNRLSLLKLHGPSGKILEDRASLCVTPFPRRILASLRPSTGSMGHFWDALVINNNIFSKQETKRFHPQPQWKSHVYFLGGVLYVSSLSQKRHGSTNGRISFITWGPHFWNFRPRGRRSPWLWINLVRKQTDIYIIFPSLSLSPYIYI